MNTLVRLHVTTIGMITKKSPHFQNHELNHLANKNNAKCVKRQKINFYTEKSINNRQKFKNYI